MAVPMVFLTVMTVLVPLMMYSLSLLPTWEYVNKTSVLLVFLSGLVGCITGATIYLHKAWSRSLHLPWRFVQDLLGYDFYIDRIYRLTVVFAVNLVSQCSAWFDRYVVDGVVNFVGLASIFQWETLKYSISGQSQGYALTILLAVSFLGMLMSWPFWGFQVLDYLSKI